MTRDKLRGAIREAIRSEIDYGPGIDVGRAYALNRATDRVLRAVERAMEVPWLEPCERCDGEGRVPCACWHGCPALVTCPACEGLGKVGRGREAVET